MRLNHLSQVGIDEVGYGSWAGPVFVCALRFKENPQQEFFDSKSISAKKREELYKEIEKIAEWKIGVGTVEEINAHSLAYAYRKAIERAVEPFAGYELLIDGRKPSFLDCKGIIGGDKLVQVISAASIIAKVSRDKLMDELHKLHPEYGWMKNKGYGTAAHIVALRQHGLSPLHRSSYDLGKYLVK